MDELQHIGDNDDCFVFIKWHGVPHVPITADIVEGLLSSCAQLKHLKLLSTKTYGYAELGSEQDVDQVCQRINNFVYKGATFLVDKMPTEPIYVPTSRNPEDVKFRADLNKTIKARAHDRLVYQQSRDKHEKKIEKQKKIEQAEKDILLQREKERRMMLEAEKRMLVPSVSTVSIGLPVRPHFDGNPPGPNSSIQTNVLSEEGVATHNVPKTSSLPDEKDKGSAHSPSSDKVPDGSNTTSYMYELINPASVFMRIKSEIQRTLGHNLRVEFDDNQLTQLVGSLKITPLPGFQNLEMLDVGFSIHPTLDFMPKKKGV